MCHVHIANQAVAAVRNRSRDCAAFRICVRARRSASNLRIFVRSNGIVRPQGGLSTQNTKTFWHHSSINNSWHEYSLKQCKPPQQRRFSRKMLALLRYLGASRGAIMRPPVSMRLLPSVAKFIRTHGREPRTKIFCTWRGMPEGWRGQEKNGLDKEFCRC
jgi:hypothetical protein